MKPKGSLPPSKELAAGPCPQTVECSLKFHSLLSSHLCLHLPPGLFWLNFCIYLLPSHACYMSHSSILLECIILVTFGGEYKLWSFVLIWFSCGSIPLFLYHNSVFLSTLVGLWNPDILLWTWYKLMWLQFMGNCMVCIVRDTNKIHL